MTDRRATGVRRWGGLLLLLALLSGLFAYVALVEFPRDQAARDAAEQAVRLLSVDPLQAAALTLTNENAVIRLAKDDAGDWRITAPVADRADRLEVQTLLTRLSDAVHERVIESSPGDPGAFGLAPAPRSLEMTIDGAVHRIEVGDQNPAGTAAYARVFAGAAGAATAPVLLVPGWVRDALGRRLFDFRNKQLLDLPASSISGLELNYADRSGRPIRLVRLEGAAGEPPADWRLVEPVETGADQGVVETLISRLTSLRATEIFDSGRSAKLTGLKRPRIEVLLTAKERRITLSLYLPFGEEAAYAATTADGPLYQINRQAVLQLDHTLFDLRDKRLAAVRPETVSRLDVADPKGSYQLDRLPSGEWQWDGRPLVQAGNEAVADFLKKLGEARVEKVVGQSRAAWPGFRLDSRSAMTITLIGGGGGAAATSTVIRLGKAEGELLYVRRGEEPESYIAPAGLLDVIPTTSKLQAFLIGSGVSSATSPPK